MDREVRLMDVIAIILAIPGFFLLFGEKPAIGILVLLLVLLIIFLGWLFNRPIFTFVELEKELEFKDRDGHLATMTRRLKGKANHKGQVEIWARKISADGLIDNFLVDGFAPAAHHIKQEAGTHSVRKPFPHALSFNEKFTMDLCYDIHDGFSNAPPVRLGHTVATVTSKLIMRINFHRDRPCRTIELFVGYGGENETRAKKQPTISNGGRTVEIELKRPKLGSEIVLSWEW